MRFCDKRRQGIPVSLLGQGWIRGTPEPMTSQRRRHAAHCAATMTDFDKARAAHKALKDFFARHPKGRLEREALDDVYDLCKQATTARQ